MKKTVFFIFLLLSVHVYLASQDLKIKEMTNYYSGNWIVAGIIENKSDKTYSFIELTLTGFDKDKNIVHTDTTYAFSPIPPNYEIPFGFLTSKDNANGIASFRVMIDGFKIGGSGSFNFEIGKITITERNSTFVKYSGEIRNINSDLRKYIEIAFIGYDANEKILYFDTTYPNKTSIPPGGVSIFDFLVPPTLSNQIKKVRCFAYSK